MNYSKILLISAITLILTACGGGGGGGSSPQVGRPNQPNISPPITPPIAPPVIPPVPLETMVAPSSGPAQIGEGKKLNFTGNMSINNYGEGTGAVAVTTGKNSVVYNSAEISMVSPRFSTGIKVGEGATLVNENKIDIKSIESTGIDAAQNTTIENKNLIELEGGSSVGIKAEKNSRIINESKGTINVTGDSVRGIEAIISDVNAGDKETIIENKGKINIYEGTSSTGYGHSAGIKVEHKPNSVNKPSRIINQKGAEINISSSKSIGIYVTEVEATRVAAIIQNYGNITVSGNDVIGIKIEALSLLPENINSIINEGKITAEGGNAKGIYLFGENLIATNSSSGTISVSGDSAVGFYAFGENSTAINKGIIQANGRNAIGMSAKGGAKIENAINGVINVTGHYSRGMYATGVGSKIENRGNIRISGFEAVGIYAENGAEIENTGSIDVSAGGSHGIYATGIGSEINNTGTINITLVPESEAIKAENGATIKNRGTINVRGTFSTSAMGESAYVVGTYPDGRYGKLSANSIDVDSTIVISSDIIKSEFKDTYDLDEILSADTVTLTDTATVVSDSLLYDASLYQITRNRVGARLTRSSNKLVDFTTSESLTSLGAIFDNYMNVATISSLNEDAKKVVRNIDTSSASSINNILKDYTPSIYANLGRQLSDTSNFFKNRDLKVIQNLGDNKFNFAFISEYSDLKSRNDINGYKSGIYGFDGAINLGNNLFGNIGYSYNEINYKNNGSGHIQTIHLGFNKFYTVNDFDLRLGFGGEYNFHNNTRDINFENRVAKSDFNSYGIKVFGEISKTFGDEAFLRPYAGLDIGYFSYDSFNESGANSLNAKFDSEGYTSVLPKIGFMIGNKFNNLKLFSGIELSHQLGDMDKKQYYRLEGFNGKAYLPKDDLESGTTSIKIGATYSVMNLDIQTIVEQNFSKRKNFNTTLSLIYKFN